MPLDLSAEALVRAGSAALFAALGVLLLVRRPRSTSTLAWGSAYTAYGGYRVYSNLFGVTGGVASTTASNLVSTAAAVAGVAAVLVLQLHLVQALEPPARGRVALALAGLLALWTVRLGLAVARLAARGSSGHAVAAEAEALALDLQCLAVAGLTLTCAGRLHAGLPRARSACLAVLPLAALLAVYISGLRLSLADSGALGAIEGLLAIGVAVAGWYPLLGGPHSRFARDALLALVAAGMLARLLQLPAAAPSAPTVVGVMRILFVLPVGYAILRADLLERPLRLPTARRGALAGLALAGMFVTAQVAQNFLSARFGLFAGGVVAGLVVFLVSPLQKAAERAIDAKPGGRAAAEYRQAVRIAWMDGRIGPKERLLLRQARERLGLSRRDAEGIEDEVTAAPPQS